MGTPSLERQSSLQRMEIQQPDNQSISRLSSNNIEIVHDFSSVKSVKNKSNCLPKLTSMSKKAGAISIGLGLALLFVTLTVGASLGTLAIPLLLLASSLILFSFFSFFLAYQSAAASETKTDKTPVRISVRHSHDGVDNIEQLPEPSDSGTSSNAVKDAEKQTTPDAVNVFNMDIPDNFSDNMISDIINERRYIKNKADEQDYEEIELTPTSKISPYIINKTNMHRYEHLFNKTFVNDFTDNDNDITENIALLTALKENGYTLISHNFSTNRAVFINKETKKGLKIASNYFYCDDISDFHKTEEIYSDKRLNDIYCSEHFYNGQYAHLAQNRLVYLNLNGKKFRANEFVYEPQLEPLDFNERIPYSVIQMIENAGFVYYDNKRENFLKINTPEGYHYIPIDSKQTAKIEPKYNKSSLRTKEIRYNIYTNIKNENMDREDKTIYYKWPYDIKF